MNSLEFTNCLQLHLLRHPSNDGRKEVNQQDRHHHQEKHRQGGFGYPEQIFACHALKHKQIETIAENILDQTL